MKRIVLLGVLCSAFWMHADELETKVQKAGLYGKYKSLQLQYDPFRQGLKQSETAAEQSGASAAKKETKTFDPKAILNSRVFIGGRWYAQGDKWGDYAIVKIANPYVTVRIEGKTMRYNINKNSNKFITSTKKSSR